MSVQPYLFFDGRCEEAADFYSRAVGAEVLMKMRFKDSPDPHQPGAVQPGAENKILHMRLRIGDSIVLASDGHCQGHPTFAGFGLSMTVSTDAEAERAFLALSDGGQVTMPLSKTFFSSRFGMLTDRFGVPWMVYVGQ